ncbi:hypothetical protein [Knoellia sp. LjRoot47]|uniref:hypothetical protein n=1 Tax=Knoellia sp. LjRoot47 TaxID=3342330 RepID=UPI003ECE878B
MTHHDIPSEHEPTSDEQSTTPGQGRSDGQEGTVSEAGSAGLNPDTALGGADSVPDTPDVNDDLDGGRTDVNVADDQAGDGADESV